MPSLPKSALVRGYVLNSLENGPARVADLVQRGHAEFGFSHGEIEAAAQHFAVVTQVKKGEIYWMRPANLIAIWWGLDRIPNHIDALPLNGERSASPGRLNPAGRLTVLGHTRLTRRVSIESASRRGADDRSGI